MTDALGQLTLYYYDALNRVTQVTMPTVAQNIAYTYDSNTSLTTCTYGKGRLCKVVDQSGTTAFAYDARGNLTKRVYQTNGITYTTTFIYDAGNKLLAINLPGNRSIIYNSRDNERRLREGLVTVNGSLATVLSTANYRADGQVSNFSYGNGETVSYSYDLSGHRTAATRSIAAANETFAWNQEGELAQRTASAVSRTYQYDTLSRLSQETGSPANQSFTYDANGNRLSNASNLYTYLTNSNRMATRKGMTLTRDAAGNHTSNGLGQRYSWDNHGHLSQFDLDNLKRATYQYNYQHLRSHKLLWKGAAAATTVYHYDLHGRLLMETSSTGAIQAYYVYDDSGTPLAMVQAANSPYNTTAQDRLLYLHTDHLGTPRMATDTAKRIVWKWESDAFGATAANQDPDADGKATVVNLRFPGQYFDAESGLHQNWHRTYDPSLGRYISSDPIGLRGGLNTFGYVEQNPLALVDPTGRNPATAAEGGYIVGGIIGAAIDYGVSATTGVVGLTLGAYLYDITHSEDGFTQNSVSDQVDTLNTDLANDPSASVPWPEKNRGKWTAICKVVDQSPDSCPTSSGNIVGWGYGIGNDMSSARKAAEKMAKATLGSSNVHHPSCKCISPKGETVPLCR